MRATAAGIIDFDISMEDMMHPHRVEDMDISATLVEYLSLPSPAELNVQVGHEARAFYIPVVSSICCMVRTQLSTEYHV